MERSFLDTRADSQLRHIYGHQADSIRTNTGNKFIFRSPDTRDSRELADFLGRAEVCQPHLSTSYGITATSDRENIGEHRALKNPVLDSEIRSLPDGVFYLRSLHMDPVKSQVQFRPRGDSRYNPQFSKAPRLDQSNPANPHQVPAISSEDSKTLTVSTS